MTENNQRAHINNIQLQSCKQPLALYIVATPIGNMEDITIRAINILTNVDFIACEDTRVTQKLLSKFNINTKLICYNDHSNEKDRNKLISLLTSGKSVALVSDAGTPLISDPGYKLIKEACEANIKITSIPGASSVITALTLSAMPTDRFYFEGFLPPKSGTRKNALENLKEINSTLIFFESARRLVASLKDIGETLKNREICVLREITKKFEETKRGSSEYLIEYYTKNPPKGEIVIVVEAPTSKEFNQTDIISQLSKALENMSVKDAVSLIADNNGVSKKEVYNLALNLKNK